MEGFASCAVCLVGFIHIFLKLWHRGVIDIIGMDVIIKDCVAGHPHDGGKYDFIYSVEHNG